MSRWGNCPHPPLETAVRRRPAVDAERDHCTVIAETYCRSCGEVVGMTGEGEPA